MATLAPVGRAMNRIERGQLDLAVVDGRFAVAHRVRCLRAIDGQRSVDGRRGGFGPLVRRVRGQGLSAEIHERGGGVRGGAGLLARWLEAFAPARFAR
jgi:hypothetical protein